MHKVKLLVEKGILEKLIFLISPFIGVFLLELIIRDNLSGTFNWISGFTKIYLFTVLIFLTLQILVLLLVNNLYLSIFITYLIFLLTSLINKYKLEIIDTPFLPWDVLFINQLIDLMPAIYKSLNLVSLILVLLILTGVFILILRKTKFGFLKIRYRVLLLPIPIIFLILLSSYNENFFKQVVSEIGGTRNQVDQKFNQKHNGMILGFILNMPSVLVDKPASYSKSTALKDIPSIEKGVYETSNLNPNIVVVMSESFWELDNLNIEFNNSSLIPTVSKYKIGHLVSSNFGGSTSNIEFEALTGFSMNNLPSGSIAYQQHVKKDIPSLPRLLLDKGYNTTAIHTYNKAFWNREEVYEYLGFEKFIGLEDLNNPPYNGLFIDDVVINDLILKEVNHNSKPSFIYAITMQNHGGYVDTRYGDKTLEITKDYSLESNQIINTYGTGINYSDKLLNNLIESINKINEPTLIIFFGDHLPALGDVYAESGYVKDMDSKTLQEELKMKQTPLVVWNNFEKDIEKIDNISAAFLPPKILKWAELEQPLYYSFLDEFHSQMPAYTSLVKMSKEGKLSIETPEKYKDIDDMYKRIQYDILFGNEYYKNEIFHIK